MIYTYFADCSFLSDDSMFKKALGSVSFNIQNKVHRRLKKEDKYRSLGAGLLLSYVLLKHYGLHEREQIFDVGKYGCPFMPKHPEIFFNISHSGDIAAASIGDMPCGVDVEKIRDVKIDVARKYFNIEEKAVSKSSEDLLRIWTIKEATVKAAGRGIAGNLDKLSVIPQKGKTEFLKKTYYFTQHRRYDYIISASSLCDEIALPREADLCRYLNTMEE